MLDNIKTALGGFFTCNNLLQLSLKCYFTIVYNKIIKVANLRHKLSYVVKVLFNNLCY